MQTVDDDNLKQLLNKITIQSDTAECNNSENWSFTALGEKACGGPKTYIPYPHSIDTAAFLVLVKKYNAAEKAFNKKYNIISDCAFVLPPTSITCDNGKPVLIYKNDLL